LGEADRKNAQQNHQLPDFNCNNSHGYSKSNNDFPKQARRSLYNVTKMKASIFNETFA